MVAQISFGAMRCYRASHRAPSDMRLSYQVKPLFLPLCHKPTIISKEHNGQGQRPLIAAERNRRPSNYFCRSLSLAAILFNKNGKRNGKALAGSQEESAPCILLEDNAIAIRVKRDKRKLGENVHFGREWLARAAPIPGKFFATRANRPWTVRNTGVRVIQNLAPSSPGRMGCGITRAGPNKDSQKQQQRRSTRRG